VARLALGVVVLLVFDSSRGGRRRLVLLDAVEVLLVPDVPRLVRELLFVLGACWRATNEESGRDKERAREKLTMLRPPWPPILALD